MMKRYRIGTPATLLGWETLFLHLSRQFGGLDLYVLSPSCSWICP